MEEVVAAIWGKDEDEEHQMKKVEEERDKQLVADVIKMMQENGIHSDKATTNEKQEVIMGKETWELIKNFKKSHFRKLMGHASEVEKRQKNTYGPKPAPTWGCTACSKKFGTSQGLTSHVVHAHNQRSDQRKLVEEIKEGNGKFRCLLCDGVYVNKKGAQLHIDRHCAKKYTQEQIVNKLIRHNLL